MKKYRPNPKEEFVDANQVSLADIRGFIEDLHKKALATYVEEEDEEEDPATKRRRTELELRNKEFELEEKKVKLDERKAAFQLAVQLAPTNQICLEAVLARLPQQN